VLSTPDETEFSGSARLGAPAPDVPVSDRHGTHGHLLDTLGHGFELLYVADGRQPAPIEGVRTVVIGEDLIDVAQSFSARFDARPGSAYLLRPDQHLCARWRSYDPAKVEAARARALGR
jgi:3-(3-hydroxy-phenyl)propionate hydroxylase